MEGWPCADPTMPGWILNRRRLASRHESELIFDLRSLIFSLSSLAFAIEKRTNSRECIDISHREKIGSDSLIPLDRFRETQQNLP